MGAVASPPISRGLQYTVTMPHKDPEARREYHRGYIARRDAEEPGYKARRLASFGPYRTAEVHAANERVRRAVDSGRLMRPERCSQCGRNEEVQAAHVDYSRPLDVRWLCRSCHASYDHPGRAAGTRRQAGPHNRDKTHCPQGHAYVEGNVYFRREGKSRICAACAKASEKRRRERR